MSLEANNPNTLNGVQADGYLRNKRNCDHGSCHCYGGNCTYVNNNGHVVQHAPPPKNPHRHDINTLIDDAIAG